MFTLCVWEVMSVYLVCVVRDQCLPCVCVCGGGGGGAECLPCVCVGSDECLPCVWGGGCSVHGDETGRAKTAELMKSPCDGCVGVGWWVVGGGGCGRDVVDALYMTTRRGRAKRAEPIHSPCDGCVGGGWWVG